MRKLDNEKLSKLLENLVFEALKLKQKIENNTFNIDELTDVEVRLTYERLLDAYYQLKYLEMD